MRVGRYEIETEIGRGGAGVVFLARGADGRRYALKLLRTTSADARTRFARETRLLGSFGEAEGFVPLVEQGDVPEGPYMVMPFLEGGSLRERLHRGPLSVDEALGLGCALAGALDVAFVMPPEPGSDGTPHTSAA